MKTIRNTLKILTLAVLYVLGSCSPVKTLIIDFPKPSPKELPESIQSLTIVSGINNKFSDLSADSLQKILYLKEFETDTVIYDITMADTTLHALGELLFESGRYDFVIPEDRFIGQNDSEKFAPELSWRNVEWLCRSFNTDAVLSMDHVAARLITSINNDAYYDPFLSGFHSLVAAQMKISYEAVFRVYEPVNKKILLYEFIKDTLIWEDADSSVRALFTRFTPAKQAIAECGIDIALQLADQISVRWTVQRRKYFVRGNAKMKHASQLAISNDWLAAMSIWKDIEENTKSPSLKSKAQYNLALAYEMNGDLDQSISWALKSYNSQFRPVTYEYLELLKRRKSELKNLSQ